MRVFELFDADPLELVQAKLRQKPSLEAGQRHLTADQYADAMTCFTKALVALPNDVTTRYYLKKTSQYLLDGRPAGDDGVLRVGKE